MCEPVSLGVATAATGGLKAFGNYQSQQASTKAANDAARRNYKYQLQIREDAWNREKALYRTKINQYHQQVQENQAAAGRAYGAEQRRLNEAFKQVAFANQAQLISLAQKQGVTQTTMQAGRSQQRAQALDLAAFGRNQAIMAENLISARQAMQYNTEEIRAQLKGANRRAYGSVAIAPVPGVAPLPPVMQQGPSQFGLFTDLASAGVSGFSAYQGMQAPKAFGFGGGSGGSLSEASPSPFNLNETSFFNTVPMYPLTF